MKPPALKRLNDKDLSVQDDPTDRVVKKLTTSINPFIGSVTGTLTKNVTIGENLAAYLREAEVTVLDTAASDVPIAAVNVTVSPISGLSASNLQAALAELQGDITTIIATPASPFTHGTGGDIFYTAGNVGIGTATPTETLDVDGTMHVSGNVEMDQQLHVAGNTTFDLVSNFGEDIQVAGWGLFGGRVGIGTAGPTVELDVVGDANISGNLTVDPETFHVDATLNAVGMGTVTPDANSKLHIVAEGSDLPVFVDRYTSVAGLPSGVLVRTARGTPSAPAAVQNNDLIGAFAVRAYGDTGFSNTANAGIAFQATQDWTDFAQGASAFIATTPNGSTGFLARLNVGQDGLVTIPQKASVGTLTPPSFSILHAAATGTDIPISADRYTGSSAVQPAGVLARTARGTASAPSAVQSGDFIGAFVARAYGATQFGATANAGIVFKASETWTDTAHGTAAFIGTTPNGSTSYVESLTVTNNGNVGIGTTTPINAKLHIVNDSSTVQPIHADTYLNGGTVGSGVVFRTARGSLSSPTALQTGDMMSSVATRGYGATGFSSTSRAAMRVIAAENWTDTAQGTNMTFAVTTPGTTTNVEKFTLTGAGNIHINSAAGRIFFGPDTTYNSLHSGTGDPNGVHTANHGSIFIRTDGAFNSTLYVKTGGTSNTNWNPLN